MASEIQDIKDALAALGEVVADCEQVGTHILGLPCGNITGNPRLWDAATQVRFRNALKKVFWHNEARCEDWYRFGHAIEGESVFSFGPPQWDVAQGSRGEQILRGLMAAAQWDADRIRTTLEVLRTNGDRLRQIWRARNGTERAAWQQITIAVRDTNRLLIAQGRGGLDPDRNVIWAYYESHVVDRLDRLTDLVEEVRVHRPATATYLEGRPFLLMLLADYDNQFGIDGIDDVVDGQGTVHQDRANQTNDRAMMHLLEGLDARVGPRGSQVTIRVQDRGTDRSGFDIIDYIDFLDTIRSRFRCWPMRSLEAIFRGLRPRSRMRYPWSHAG